jgi:putative cardiolipin synthase
MCLVMASCVSAFKRPDASDYPRTASYAISQDVKTSLRDSLGARAKAHPGKSGFLLLPNGNQSLRMRLAMVMAAEKTIDLQYYAMHDDSAANLMLEGLLRAAERGVRVRFLIDNISLNDVDKSLSILDSNPNIQVRVFNPLATRKQGPFGFIGAALHLDKGVKRMHNKALISDNQISITGGRNIGDEYFDARRDVNFKDLDMLSAGPVVARVSASFDKYWNSDDSFPIRALRPGNHDGDDIAALRKALKAAWDKEFHKEKSDGVLSTDIAHDLKNGDIKLVWAKAELSADDPEKINQDADAAVSKPLSKLETLLSGAKHEFVVVSPYFVPGDDGLAWLAGLEKRGVQVKILTNSLASTDVVAVHTGYKKYREGVVESGIDLYEFKPIAGERPRQRLFGSSAPPQASLHSKVYVIDRSVVVLGSYNLDPRSTELNTEIVTVIHSPELAAQVIRIFDQSTDPKSSYHLEMGDHGLEWVTQDEAGRSKVFTHDPGAGFVRNVETGLFSLLPIEGQL